MKRTDPSPAIPLLWGSRARPRRGPKPALSLDAVVAAAVALADVRGLAAVTMHAVASRLGVTTMALYRYVPAKESLVELMIDAALGRPPAARGRGWRADLSGWAEAERATLRRHPWLVESVARRSAVGPNALAWIESAFAVIAVLELEPRDALAVVMLVDGHVRAAAQVSAGAAASPEWAASFGAVLRGIRDDSRYATVAGVAAAGGFAPSPAGAPDGFAFGLERILDGVEAFSRGRLADDRRPTPVASLRSSARAGRGRAGRRA